MEKRLDQSQVSAIADIDYRIGAVQIAHVAILHAMRWAEKGAKPTLKVHFDDVLVITGNAAGFTNSAIESGLLQTRALVEFLGLKRKGDVELQEISCRRPDDLGIEHFGRPRMTRIAFTAATYPEAEAMFAQVLAAADKALAHLTTGFNRERDGAPISQVFQLLPQVVVNALHKPLGIAPPRAVVAAIPRQKSD